MNSGGCEALFEPTAFKLRMTPGQIALTRTPFGPNSAAASPSSLTRRNAPFGLKSANGDALLQGPTQNPTYRDIDSLGVLRVELPPTTSESDVELKCAAPCSVCPGRHDGAAFGGDTNHVNWTTAGETLKIGIRSSLNRSTLRRQILATPTDHPWR